MPDVFISYARADRPDAERIAAVLEQHGWSVWWDRKILAGETFDDSIQRALNEARCVVVLWSSSAADSDWVKDEATDGKRREILVPVLVADVTIPIGFRQVQTIAIPGAAAETDLAKFDDLVASVGAVLHRTDVRPSEPPVQSAAIRGRSRPAPAPTKTVPRWALYAALGLLAIVGAWSIWQPTATAPRTGPGTPGNLAPAPGVSATGPGAASVPTVGSPPTVAAQPVAVSTQEIPAATTEVLVSGVGQDIYYVYNASGDKQLKVESTNKPVELFPGPYVIAVHNVRRSVVLSQAHRTIIATGTLKLIGTGADIYYVHDAEAKTLAATQTTGQFVELFPGNYSVALHGVKVVVAVQPGRETSLLAGSVLVPGSGSTIYYVYDSEGKVQLATQSTGAEVELFPGAYVVELNSVRKSIRVEAGKKAVLDK